MSDWVIGGTSPPPQRGQQGDPLQAEHTLPGAPSALGLYFQVQTPLAEWDPATGIPMCPHSVLKVFPASARFLKLVLSWVGLRALGATGPWYCHLMLLLFMTLHVIPSSLLLQVTGIFSKLEEKTLWKLQSIQPGSTFGIQGKELCFPLV